MERGEINEIKFNFNCTNGQETGGDEGDEGIEIIKKEINPHCEDSSRWEIFNSKSVKWQKSEGRRRISLRQENKLKIQYLNSVLNIIEHKVLAALMMAEKLSCDAAEITDTMFVRA